MAKMMWVDDRFFDCIKEKVEYDKNALKKIKKYAPDADVYPSSEKATGAIYEKFIYPQMQKKTKGRRKKNGII